MGVVLSTLEEMALVDGGQNCTTIALKADPALWDFFLVGYPNLPTKSSALKCVKRINIRVSLCPV